MASPKIDKAQGELREISERWLDRWQDALQDSRQGEYSATRLLSDVVDCSVDTIRAWYLPYDLLIGEDRPPLAKIYLEEGKDGAFQELRVAPVKTAKLLVDDLTREGESLQGKVEPQLLDERTLLVVVKGLAGVKRGPAFRTKVYPKEKPDHTIAEIRVVIV